MVSNPAYRSDTELDKREDDGVIKVFTSREGSDDRAYSYEEALELAGNGWYNIGLLMTMALAIEAMSLDMFGFSAVVTGATCDFHLNQTQTTILLSVPFLGPIVMAYPWGYISDTQGRRRSLLIASWGAFAATVVGALSPSWEAVAVCKFISTCFSSCLQSVPYALMGESCCARVRSGYIIVMASVMMFCITVYMGLGYLILNLNFSLNLWFVSFTPWRLLAITLGLPLGVCALCLYFFYESPKFLANAGHEKKAVETLHCIWLRNGGSLLTYPVKKLLSNEERSITVDRVTFLHSLLDQLLPLFQGPLLWRTLQLFYITAAIYFANSSLFMWFPFLTKEFSSNLSNYSHSGHIPEGLCDIIGRSQDNVKDDATSCTTVDLEMFIISTIQGFVFTSINLGISKTASRKKIVMLVLLIFSALCGIGAVHIKDPVISVILFIGTLIETLCIGILFSYFVELYPTSYRGMASCLSVMLARGGGWLGVNLLGLFVVAHCQLSFFVLAGFLFSAAAVACFLPR